MPVTENDIAFYGSANMPETDSGTAGGAIDTTTLVVMSSASLFNAPGGAIEVVSDNAADTMDVVITGRNSQGSIVSETVALNGTTAVDVTQVFGSLLKIVLDSAAAGTVTVRLDGAGATIVAMPAGVETVRRPFYNVGADASGGSARAFYEKLFAYNSHATLALLNATVTEQADAESQLTFALETAQNGSGTSADRLTEPAGITGDGFGSHSALAIPGTDLGPEDGIGIWLKLDLPAGDSATSATYTIRVQGNTVQ